MNQLCYIRETLIFLFETQIRFNTFVKLLLETQTSGVKVLHFFGFFQWTVGGGVITDRTINHAGGVAPWVVHVVDRVLYAPHGNLYTTMTLAPDLTIFTEYLTADEEILEMMQG